MTKQKNRFKAVIDNQTYIIIGPETTEHMNMVTKLVNEQLNELKELASQTNSEQAAILLAFNAISDQVKKQEQLLSLMKENDELRKRAVKVVELENRIKRIEAIEVEAKEALERNGRSDLEIHNHVEAQQFLNAERKRKIQKKTMQG